MVKFLFILKGTFAAFIYIIIFSSIVMLGWLPILLLSYIVGQKLFKFKPLDIKSIPSIKLMIVIWAIPYLVSCGSIYRINMGKELPLLQAFIIGCSEALAYAIVGIFLYFISRSIGKLILEIFEQWLSHFVDLKRKFSDAYKNSPIPVIIGIFSTCCLLAINFNIL